jgi:hypothetical protein
MPCVNVPETRYATAYLVHSAYQVFGHGDTDFVIHFPWIRNIDITWDLPEFATLLQVERGGWAAT